VGLVDPHRCQRGTARVGGIPCRACAGRAPAVTPAGQRALAVACAAKSCEVFFDEATALSVAQDELQSHPGLGAIYAEDDDMGVGVIQAVKSAHKLGKIVIYGVGGEVHFVAAIKAGEAQATVPQDPWSYADAGIEAIRDVLAGKKLLSFAPIAMPTITSALPVTTPTTGDGG